MVQSPEYAGKLNLRQQYQSSKAKQNFAAYEDCFDPENATPDSQLEKNRQGKIVNESSLFGEEVQDYILDNDFELKDE